MAEIPVRKMKTIWNVFSGCAQLLEKGKFRDEKGEPDSMGECMDMSIISEEEGGFKLTELGKKMYRKGKKARKGIV